MNIAAGIESFWDNLADSFKENLKEYLKGYVKDFWTGSKPMKLVRDPPQHNCITRSEELTQLKELFNSFDRRTDDKTVYAVYLVGLPGSGKSELARQYRPYANMAAAN